MKTVLVAVVVALAWAGSAVAAPETDRESYGLVGPKTIREREGLVGPVQKVVESSAPVTINNGEIVEAQPTDKFITTFDRQGNFIEWQSFNSSGALDEWTVAQYETPGYIRHWTKYAQDGAVKRKIVGTYDPERNISEQIIYSGDGSLSHYGITTFDSDGNIVEAVTTEPDGRVLMRIVFSYNSKQQKTREVIHGEIKAETTQEFRSDARGNLENHRILGADGSTWLEYRFSEYALDLRGNWIRRKSTAILYGKDGSKDEIVSIRYRAITYY